MTDDLKLPDFLNRKINPSEPRDPATALQEARDEFIAEIKSEGAVRVYCMNRIPNTRLVVGWNTVVPVTIGWKWARIRMAGKTRCYRIKRHVWDSLQQREV